LSQGFGTSLKDAADQFEEVALFHEAYGTEEEKRPHDSGDHGKVNHKA